MLPSGQLLLDQGLRQLSADKGNLLQSYFLEEKMTFVFRSGPWEGSAQSQSLHHGHDAPTSQAFLLAHPSLLLGEQIPRELPLSGLDLARCLL